MTSKETGRTGGNSTKERHGSDHFRRAGKLGGQMTARRGAEFFRELSRKGAAKRSANKKQAKAVLEAAQELLRHEQKLSPLCTCMDIPRFSCCTCGAYEAACAFGELRNAVGWTP